MLPVVAIAGRPNVGKSTLFNRLAGKRLALVHDLPGVTRDRREAEGRLADLTFRIIDTAGIESGEGLSAAMRASTERAVADADLCLFMVDARAGVTAADRQFADFLRRTGKPIILIANKAEGRAGGSGLLDAYSLGLGEPISFSAAHGEGMDALHEALKRQLPDESQREPAPVAEDRPLHLAVVGRPNAGKSTLVNALLGEDRMLTGPEPGITRDAIGIAWAWRGRKIRLWDTAGLRRKARVTEELERLAVADALRAVKFAEVAILLLDAQNPFDKQDLQLADLIEREGRAIVIAVNKWDRIEDKQRELARLREEVGRLLPQLSGVSVVAVSALRGIGLERLMQAALDAHAVWNRRIPTADLNRWLGYQVARHPPPAPKGRRLRLKFLSQVGVRPPTFAVFGNRASELPEAYKRYLVNGLREDFGFPGVPIRLNMRERGNPFDR